MENIFLSNEAHPQGYPQLGGQSFRDETSLGDHTTWGQLFKKEWKTGSFVKAAVLSPQGSRAAVNLSTWEADMLGKLIQFICLLHITSLFPIHEPGVRVVYSAQRADVRLW